MDLASIIHISSNILTGSILSVIGTVIFFRNREKSVNRSFLGFFLGIGGYLILDGIFILIAHYFSNPIELVRDLTLISMLIGVNFGLIGTLIITFSEIPIFRFKTQLLLWLSSLSLIIVGIVGDNAGEIEMGHAKIMRHWSSALVIVGGIIIYGIIIITLLLQVQKGSLDKVIRNRIKYITEGMLLILGLIVLFEISYSIEPLMMVMELSIVHISIHILMFLGASALLRGFAKKT